MSDRPENSPEARKMQKRIRRAMSDFGLARIGQDDLMTFAALGTEFVGALFEMMNRLGYAPTEDQFVKMLSTWATIVARGEHFDGVRKEAGNV